MLLGSKFNHVSKRGPRLAHHDYYYCYHCCWCHCLPWCYQYNLPSQVPDSSLLALCPWGVERFHLISSAILTHVFLSAKCVPKSLIAREKLKWCKNDEPALDPSFYRKSQFNPLNSELFLVILRKHRYVFIFSIISPHLKIQVLQICPHGWQGLVYPQNQYHSCWCPGNSRSQTISSHGIDLVLLEHYILSCRRVRRLPYIIML